MRLNLDDLDGKETREFKGFNDRLLGCLPGLNDHQCSLGRPGGFVQRPEEGTYFGYADFQVANLLAAVAACRAQNVPREAIANSLKKFTSYRNNPGRVNLYKLNGGHVMVD